MVLRSGDWLGHSRTSCCQRLVYRLQGSQAQESQTECKMESFNKCPSNMLHNTNKKNEYKTNMGTKTSIKSKQIKCIYIALRTSADISKCCTETQPKTPNSKQCRCKAMVNISAGGRVIGSGCLQNIFAIFTT